MKKLSKHANQVQHKIIKQPMILLIADSICGGFGQRDKKSFVHLAAEQLDIPIWDESATGMSSSAYLEHLHTGCSICPEQQMPIENLDEISVVIISLGNVDGKKKYKNKNILGSLIPSRYRNEKIDPRPYYSSRTWKRLIEKSDNLARHIFRHYALTTGNLENTAPFEVTAENLNQIIERFKSKQTILISTSIASEFHFPGASRNFLKINKLLREKTSNNITFFDLQKRIKENHLLDDKFHLNSAGHNAIKQDFIEILTERLAL